MASRAREARPAPLDPRGLSRVDAASYFGISPTLFDQLVRAGVLLQAKALQSRNMLQYLGPSRARPRLRLAQPA